MNTATWAFWCPCTGIMSLWIWKTKQKESRSASETQSVSYLYHNNSLTDPWQSLGDFCLQIFFVVGVYVIGTLAIYNSSRFFKGICVAGVCNYAKESWKTRLILSRPLSIKQCAVPPNGSMEMEVKNYCQSVCVLVRIWMDDVDLKETPEANTDSQK